MRESAWTGRGGTPDNIFLERLWRTVKYEEVYLKAYANVVEAQMGLEDCFRFYNDLRSHQPPGRGRGRLWATGPRPRCSTGGRESKKRSPVEGGVQPALEQNYWQEPGTLA